ncbi:lysyl-tRNA synthetase, class II [Legionella quinlivanii]|uniref:Lysyl-tRNA synthetase, class II n=1 Tax=Legionella quinlivanii TaxID=45073 RepID=A0A0W0Y175_9GAMM|nr:elongation factor P--(R)-beta-lysine ligase [Legionella quinlivanii]KTD50302.1 lysyl-tRNA synthetase, class II [Legionella quinlivanii]SEF44121.1 lysyl-tRNA synthetase, class 2 [Legionella quinlivanii DSM 21216]STY11902.1 lysyl-tRNA synthetase, class II [Legionella quinlivanii]
MHLPDQWQPSTSIQLLRQRAAIMNNIRSFFNQRGYLEVETPAMARCGITDVYLSNIKAIFRNQTYYLQTSPEYHMKRLLAAGSGPIFQMAKAYRDDEVGRHHNPEFTMLEWYQLDIDHHALIKEVDELLQTIINCPPAIRKTYQQVFEELCAVDPFAASITDYRHCLKQFELDYVLAKNERDPDQYLFLLMSHVIEPALASSDAPVVIYDFPVSQAALAQVNNGRAQRFEFYYRGMELANGFHELLDIEKQRQRFNQDLAQRERLNLELPPIDPLFLAALAHGLPACSGVALGVDRLIMLALQQTDIASVLSFDFSRA